MGQRGISRMAVAAIVLLGVMQIASSLRFYLNAGETRCFSESVKPTTRVLGEYTVATGKGHMPVDIVVRDTEGKTVLFERKDIDHGKFAFIVPLGKESPKIQTAELHRLKEKIAEVAKHAEGHDGDHRDHEHGSDYRHENERDREHGHDYNHENHPGDHSGERHGDSREEAVHHRRTRSLLSTESDREYHERLRREEEERYERERREREERRDHEERREHDSHHDDHRYDDHHYREHDNNYDGRGRHSEGDRRDHEYHHEDYSGHDRDHSFHHSERYRDDDHRDDDRHHDRYRDREGRHSEHDDEGHRDRYHDEDHHHHGNGDKQYTGPKGDGDGDDWDLNKYDGIDEDDLNKRDPADGHFKGLDKLSDVGEELFASRKFEICISSSNPGEKDLKRRVRLFMRHGKSAHDYTRLAKKEHLSSLEVSLRQVSDDLQELQADLDRARKMEDVLSLINQNTNRRVVMYASIAVATMIAVGIIQASYTKRFFKHKKLL